MKRLTLSALLLSLALEVPGVAQTTADMSPDTRHYGPRQSGPEKATLARRRPNLAADIGEPASMPQYNRMIAVEQLAPGTTMGLGLFGYMKPEKPYSIRGSEPVNRSRIAAVGLSVAF